MLPVTSQQQSSLELRGKSQLLSLKIILAYALVTQSVFQGRKIEIFNDDTRHYE
jgi:hypothetical protein